MLSVALGACHWSQAGELPVPCGGSACTGGLPFVGSGSVSATATGNLLTVNQSSDKALLNWASFNVGAGNTVQFVQPSSSSLAVNRIFQNDPSSIFGSISANGQIYLINQNGILFGQGAQVNANSLVASSLDITSAALADGIASPSLLNNPGNVQPAFASSRVYVTDVNGNQIKDAAGNPIPVQVQVQAGAQLSSAANGRVMLLGQTVDNAGSVSSPSGQVILASGQKVYLQASTDAELRGLLVEVDVGGTVWNRITGDVASPTGNVSLVGLAVNQDGRVSATTSVNADGSVYLLGQDTMGLINNQVLSATRGGTVELGAGSATAVMPDYASTLTAPSDQAQQPSKIVISGQQIRLDGGSAVRAPAGNVSLTAIADPFGLRSNPNLAPAYDPQSEIRIDSGATIDVSGSDVTLPVASNLVSVQLNSNELANDPVQRDGILRGQTVTVDARIGTPLADVSQAIAAIPYAVGARTTNGGSVSIESAGDAVLSNGATINVSGGVTTYTGGLVATTQLVGANGKTYDIGSADPLQTYVGLINPTSKSTDGKWGVQTVANGPAIGTYEPGYVQGASAGSVQFAARSLIVNGTLLGSVTKGIFQRTAGNRAQGGDLIVGLEPQGTIVPLDFWSPSVTFSDSTPTIALDPSQPLPSWYTTFELPTSYLTSGGFTRTDIYSDGSVTLPSGSTLNLAPYSVFNLNGSRVDVERDIRAPDAILEFGASLAGPLASGVSYSSAPPALQVGSGVTLDVSGTWVNDAWQVTGADPGVPTPISGGSVTLSAGSVAVGAGTTQVAPLQIGNGVTIDASAGAWSNAGGAITYGRAGTITLDAGGHGSPVSIGTGLTLNAYGLNGQGGGRLNISAARIEVTHLGAPWSSGENVVFSNSNAAALQLSDQLFATGGFASYAVTATGGVGTDAQGASVAPLVIDGTADIQAQQATRVLEVSNGQQPSTAALAGIAPVQLLPQYQRAPVALTFGVNPASSFVNPSQQGDLVVARGAIVGVDPGSGITLNASTDIRVDGTLAAPAGSIGLNLLSPSTALDRGYLPGQGIYLGATGVLDARGAVEYFPNDAGLLQGRLLGGGTINLDAARGSLYLNDGALIDASGVSGAFDLLPSGNATGYSRQTLASGGGNISLTALEGMDLGARLLADPGQPAASSAGPGGGSLSITLSRDSEQSGFFVDPTIFQNPQLLHFPDTPLTIVIAPGEGTNPNGSMIFDPALIAAGGFSSLSLAADSAIQLTGGTSLALPASLALRAPNLDVSGVGAVTLNAPYVALGSAYTVPQSAQQPASVGTSSLNVNAGLIELSGNLSLQGFDSTTLTASNDLRMIGVLNGQQLTGTFNAAGVLQMSAREIYPTTLTHYTINVPDGRIVTGSTGSAQPVLEAGGSLTLTADTIDQGGAIEAPFGQIALDAQTQLTLEPGSLTSVSGNGQIIPFGHTLNGLSWVYDLNSSGTTVETTLAAPPTKQITLSGANVNVASGATVDLQGGGDLYAYEFIPGTGGTRDALSIANAGSTFAILPGVGTYAPYDPQEQNPAIQPGQSIYLAGIPGTLAAGTYALLPARYALLPGAFLVTPVANTLGLQPASGVALTDGTPVVSGYYATAGTSLRSSVPSGFAVRPGSYGRQLAQYGDTYASAFFQAAASSSGTPAPQLPVDAGSLTLAASQQLGLSGNFQTQAAGSGQGAAVDVSATDLQVFSGAASANPQAGVVELTTDELERLQAQSLLLGGKRSFAAGDVTLDVTADNVSVAPGATLTAPEVLLTARNLVEIGANAQLSGTGAAIPRSGGVTLDSSTGTSALVRVSSGAQINLTQLNSSNAGGTVDIQPGAELTASQSITLSATADTRSNGTLNANGGSVSLRSSQISLGDGASTTHGLILSNAQLASLGSLQELRLISDSTVDLFGSVALGGLGAGNSPTIGSLVVDAGAMRGFGVAGDAAHIVAGDLKLLNDVGANAGSAGTGTGTLTLEGSQTTLSSGSYALSGFDSAMLESHGDLVLNGALTLSAQNDLSLDAARVVTTSGTTATLAAPGHGVVIAVPNGATAGKTAAGLGASLSVSAASIQDDGVLLAPSGSVKFDASGALTLGSDARIDTAGLVETLGGNPVSTPGGQIALIAEGGDLTLAAGSGVDVSGGSAGGDAGAVTLEAAGAAHVLGSLVADSASGGAGGRFSLSAAQVDDFDALNAMLNRGNFSANRSFELRTGNVVLDAGASIVSQAVDISADAGALTLNGLIDARAASGGSVQMYSGGDLTLGAGGAVLADATGGGAVGGTVVLGSTSGHIVTAAGSLVSLTGSAGGGALQLRAASTGSGVQITQLGGTVAGAASETVDVVHLYDGVSQINSSFIAQVQNDLQNFDAQAIAIATALGQSTNPAFVVQPAIEVRSEGDLTLASTWDLLATRTGTGAPGELTLRAAGNLNLDATLSDGFVASGSGNSQSLTQMSGPSWAYRLAAGANLSAADPNAVQPLSAVAAGSGDVTLASAVSVRTGTGSIEVTAARDLQLADQTSVIYTAGRPAMPAVTAFDGSGHINYATGGGNVSVAVGNDVIGAATDQVAQDYLLRQGGSLRVPVVTWGPNFSIFQAGIGALGGGNVSVTAGRDLVDLSAVIPTSGRTNSDQSVSSFGGGNLSVRAGRNIDSGVFYVGNGVGLIRAGGAIAPGSTGSLSMLLEMGKGSLNVVAGTSVSIESMLNPTMLGQVTSKPQAGDYFLTYDGASSANLLALSGNLALLNDDAAIQGVMSQWAGRRTRLQTPTASTTTYPGTFSAVALGGDISTQGNMLLFPSATGNLDLLASGNVIVNGPITESDAFASNVPTPVNVQTSYSTATQYIITAAAAALHQPDPQIDHIVAANGDVGGTGILQLAEPLQMAAGRDISGVTLQVQNLRPGDVTVLQAGRDVNYVSADPSAQITLGGPGSLDLFAGRNVNLGFTTGISTVGADVNPLLPAGGADINLFAGLGQQPDYGGFIQHYLVQADTYSTALTNYMQGFTGTGSLTASGALSAFQALPLDNQLPLLLQVFFDELRASGLEASQKPSLGYARGFDAINTLFPGSVQSDGTVTPLASLPYAGDLDLYFSRLYTVAGGNINLLVPGGAINVGLATPPPSIANRPPSDLGIVAEGRGQVNAYTYGNVLVNQSRVFTLDGGDVTIWSSTANIDAGRGAKSSVSAPPPQITIDPSGNLSINFAGAVAGSGIRTIQTDLSVAPGNVNLIAPLGTVNAGEAGIVSAGNVNIAAAQVVGVNNIQAAGVETGVPLATNSLAASLSGVSGVASAAASTAQSNALPGASAQQASASAGEAALSWLDVFIVGLGQDVCKPDDLECLKRQAPASAPRGSL